MAPFNVVKCGLCPARVVWAVTEVGERMPVDADPYPGGMLLLGWRGEVLRSRVALRADRVPGQMYRSHLASCPAAAWRRRTA